MPLREPLPLRGAGAAHWLCEPAPIPPDPGATTTPTPKSVLCEPPPVLLHTSLGHMPAKLNHSLPLNIKGQRNHNNLPRSLPIFPNNNCLTLCQAHHAFQWLRKRPNSAPLFAGQCLKAWIYASAVCRVCLLDIGGIHVTLSVRIHL